MNQPLKDTPAGSAVDSILAGADRIAAEHAALADIRQFCELAPEGSIIRPHRILSIIAEHGL